MIKFFCRKCEGVQRHYLNEHSNKMECCRCKDMNTDKARHDYQNDMGGGTWKGEDI